MREGVCHAHPPVFAAASDVDNTSIDRFAGSQEGSQHHVFRRSGRIRSSSRNRADLHRGPCRAQGKNWPTCDVAMPESEREGRRKGARAWQDLFKDTLLSKECPGTFKQSLKSPTILYSSELEIALDLHVDDSNVTGQSFFDLALRFISTSGCFRPRMGFLRWRSEVWVVREEGHHTTSQAVQTKMREHATAHLVTETSLGRKGVGGREDSRNLCARKMLFFK